MSNSSYPDFFIVGAPKCGTTAMARYVGDHPEIFMPAAKELHYFGSDLDYRRRRPTKAEYVKAFRNAGNAKRRGEASVGYLYSNQAPQEILEASPAAQVLIMLRDPVEMVQSQHAQELFMGQEDIEDLESALAAESERLQGERIPATCTAPYLLRYTWLARYSEHVERYLNAFGDDRVHVTLFDDFRADTPRAYADVIRFLGCDPNYTPPFPVVNRRKRVRSRIIQRIVRDPPPAARSIARCLLPLSLRVRTRNLLYRANTSAASSATMSEDLKRRLRQEFAPDVRRLQSLIHRDLSAWLPY